MEVSTPKEWIDRLGKENTNSPGHAEVRAGYFPSLYLQLCPEVLPPEERRTDWVAINVLYGTVGHGVVGQGVPGGGQEVQPNHPGRGQIHG